MCFLIVFHLGQGTLELRRETSVMQTSDMFVFLTSLKKKYFFVWVGAIIENIFDSIDH